MRFKPNALCYKDAPTAALTPFPGSLHLACKNLQEFPTSQINLNQLVTSEYFRSTAVGCCNLCCPQCWSYRASFGLGTDPEKTENSWITETKLQRICKEYLRFGPEVFTMHLCMLSSLRSKNQLQKALSETSSNTTHVTWCKWEWISYPYYSGLRVTA